MKKFLLVSFILMVAIGPVFILTTTWYEEAAHGIGDPILSNSGNAGYDVEHYDLDITWLPQSKSIDAYAEINCTATKNMRTFNLDFNGFEVEELLVNDIPTKYLRFGQEFQLLLTRENWLDKGDDFSIKIHYKGVPNSTINKDGYLDGWNQYSGGVMVASEPDQAPNWIPVNDHPLDKATYHMLITVPKPYIAAANGEPGSITDNGDTRTYEFNVDQPMASYLATVNVSKFQVDTVYGPNELPIINYYPEYYKDEEKSPFKRLPEMIETFNSLFGTYPFNTAGVIVVDDELNFALETQSRSIFGTDAKEEWIVAHELAHQWFGDSVSLKSWQETWLKEGFASYAEILWEEHAISKESAENHLKDWYAMMTTFGGAHISKEEFIQPFASGFIPLPEVDITEDQILETIKVVAGKNVAQQEIANALLIMEEKGMLVSNIPFALEAISFDQVYANAKFYNDFYLSIGFLESARTAEDIAKMGPPMPPGKVEEPWQMYSTSVYKRGALTLHALRLKVGDETFFKILREFAERYQYSNASTEDFITLSEEISGQALNDFFREWLHENPIPDIPQMGLSESNYTYD
jgi:aminopeptidase N